MNLHNPGSALARFRDQTERQKRMPGVTLASFNCKACGWDRKIAGREQYVKGTTKFGYICAACAEKRRAKRALKEAA